MVSAYISFGLKFFFLFTPFFALSMFLAMTADRSPAERRALAHRVALATVVISGALLFFGPFIFAHVGITVDAFRIGAGILLLLLAYFILYKTRLGLRLRSCGEHPQAADSVGINVYKMRYIGVMASGFLGGIGGMAYIMPANSIWNFEQGVTGMGFLALAVMIFGQWKPFRIALAAVFFSLFRGRTLVM